MSENGVWRTVGGRRIFIKDGQELGDAMKESGKFKNLAKTEKPKSEFGNREPEQFAKDVEDAKKTVDPSISWRVTAHTVEELKEWYPSATFHTTEGGSTVAVTKDGDIISVCKYDGDTCKGRDLLAMAVQNGGVKLDSYEGNHGFYDKCGFEPVSWCKWDDEYKPDGWKEPCKRENIIFYKYVGAGKTSGMDAESFKATVPASKDYDSAQQARDEALKKETEK